VKILFLCISLFKLELKRGKMENKMITRSLRRQLDQAIVHEQVENGTVINKNLSANQIDQQFITL
jgi:hypothetical protein